MKVNKLLRINQELKTLLEEKLPLRIKFRVQNFLDKIEPVVSRTYEERDNIILELEPVTKNIKPQLEDGSTNPKFTEYNSRFGELLADNIDDPGTLELLPKDIEDIETTNHYPILHKWLNW